MNDNTPESNENSFDIPNASDKLFIEFNEDYQHNAMISSGISKFFLFSDAYRTASIVLFDQLDGSAYLANTLIYPIVFLNRHFLELRLKELISGLNYAIKAEYKFSPHHKLKDLWCDYKKLLPQVGDSYCPSKESLLNVEKLIIEFQTIDPQSFCFRYPVDTSGKPSLKMTNLDLKNFREIMNKLYNFFEVQSDVVFHLIDLADEAYLDLHYQYHQDMINSFYY